MTKMQTAPAAGFTAGALLDRVNYLTDPAYAGRFDPNPMHAPHGAV
jgi:hypothetical protein